MVGNPNVGKSVLFGYLTGRYVTVSNYPGTTVEIASGMLAGEGGAREVIDTPGVNNLLPTSEDEQVTRNILLNRETARIIQVADAKNLKRGLLISVQLAEMGRPYLLCLNMTDEARDRGITVDTGRLSAALGIPVIETIATQKAGLDEVRRLALKGRRIPRSVEIDYPQPVMKALAQLEPLLPATSISARSLALMLLAQGVGRLHAAHPAAAGGGHGAVPLGKWLATLVDPPVLEAIQRIVEQTQRQFSRSLNVEITQARMRAAGRLADDVLSQRETGFAPLTRMLSRLTVHPVAGLGVVAACLVGMYYFVGVLGAGILVDWLELGVFGTYIVPGLTDLVENVLPWPWLRDLLVGQFGLLSMALSYSIAIVLPIVGTFFIAFGLLEDSGYLPRLSVMMNRIFRA
ncbi:MAG: FeoB small GTPase domain-containing protein, partial [Candidatus Neomarinimicrobiota bacterium]